MRRHTWSYGSCSRGTRPSLEMLLPQHKILQDLIVLAQMISKSSEAPRRNEMPPWKALRTPKWKHLISNFEIQSLEIPSTPPLKF